MGTFKHSFIEWDASNLVERGIQEGIEFLDHTVT